MTGKCEWCGEPAVAEREIAPGGKTAGRMRLAKVVNVCETHRVMIERNRQIAEMRRHLASLRRQLATSDDERKADLQHQIRSLEDRLAELDRRVA